GGNPHRRPGPVARHRCHAYRPRGPGRAARARGGGERAPALPAPVEDADVRRTAVGVVLLCLAAPLALLGRAVLDERRAGTGPFDRAADALVGVERSTAFEQVVREYRRAAASEEPVQSS